MRFTLIKSRAMTLSRSLQCRAYSRAVMDEKSLSSLFPVGGGGSGYKRLVHRLVYCSSVHRPAEKSRLEKSRYINEAHNGEFLKNRLK